MKNYCRIGICKAATVAVLTLGLASVAAAEDPYAAEDDTWISVSGEVQSVTADEFVLDFGDDTIVVEMDDGDRDADAYQLLVGDEVIVNGMIDDDLFESRTIEASSVYVDKIDTYFYASAVDEEDGFITLDHPFDVSATVLQGTVTAVNSDDFRLATGSRMVTVNVDEMPYDPLDDEGYQRIRVGDQVSVSGRMDYSFIDGREFAAESVVTLID